MFIIVKCATHSEQSSLCYCCIPPAPDYVERLHVMHAPLVPVDLYDDAIKPMYIYT